MDSNDPEERIRELERQLADARGGPRENVLGRYEERPAQAPGMMPVPSSGVNPNSYDLLRYQGAEGAASAALGSPSWCPASFSWR
jgi:hypothetical protein